MLTEWFHWSELEWILTAVFLLLFLLQLYFYLFYYQAVPRFAKRIQKGKIRLSEEQPPVSVILTTRDQCEQLGRLLPALLEQNYPKFEVIVINDASTDETEDTLKRLSLTYPHLYSSFVPAGTQNISTRKMALTVGIKAAKYDYLLFTEANCKPVGANWISSMMEHFTPETEVVLGYSKYEAATTVSKLLVAFDNLFQSVRFLGAAAAGKPYMGSGRNLAYRKRLFFNGKGFSSHLNLKFGEDDLFVSDVATSGNTRIAVSEDSMMLVETSDCKSLWREMRISRIFTSSFYKPRARFRNGLEVSSRYLFLGLFAALLTLSILASHWLLTAVAGLLLLTRLLIQLIVLNNNARLFSDKRFYLCILLMDLYVPFRVLLLRLDRMYHRQKPFTKQILH